MRSRITWVIVGAVVVIGVFAGLDALRSSGGEPSRADTAEQEIERTGNEWARLFAAGRTCNRFMHQPACEWVGCETHAGPIPNCTPVSLKIQRLFAGAVVQDVAIRGKWAAARFSNGETVRLLNIGISGSWWIDRVGAGRQFFE
jgi:hypothetical protein